MLKNTFIGIAIFANIFLVSCASQPTNITNNKPQKEDNLTVGIVQKEIKVGMSQVDVVSVLGSPNIVSSVKQDQETWIYDKISSTVYNKKENAYGTLILIGASSESSGVTSSQKTLTVIINFIKGKVNDFKYHTSKF